MSKSNNKAKTISIRELSGKNINFLFGSGASAPYLPTLYVENEKKSLEEIFTELEVKDKENTIEYYYWQKYYWDNILKKGYLEEIDKAKKSDYSKIFKNYKKFLQQIVYFLNLQNEDHSGKINIFTTNYDMFFERSADKLLKEHKNDFIFNDGTKGFFEKIYHISNYDKIVYKAGVFGRKYKKIPTINLFKIHGSLSWNKKDNNIHVEYNCPNFEMEDIEYEKSTNKYIIKGKNYNGNEKKTDVDIKESIENYNKLQIVNPTKKKFADTLLDENYFHQIRTFTYELENENSILIIFGFSFADEHIIEIIKRSISNKDLQVFIFVYNQDEYEKNYINKDGNKFLLECDNVKFILPEDNGTQDFTIFNQKIFTKSEV